MSTAYGKLLDKVRNIHLLESSASLLGWDQETMMPEGGVAFRAKQLKALSEVTHQQAVSAELGDLLAECEGDPALTSDPDSESAVNLREIRRSYDRETRLPVGLVAEISETTSLAQHEWTRAREDSDFERFRPWLEKILGLMRSKAECLGPPQDGEPWDALGDLYETGMRARELQGIFSPLRERLCALIQDLRETGDPPGRRIIELELPISEQEAFVRFVAEAMGFDFGRGRIDKSTHPFCSGTHCNDVRITTRFHQANVLDALGSTMHEAGHGIYEQGLPEAHIGTPMGSSVSLGIHESQSRLWENMVGRSEAFWRWLNPHLPRFFGKKTKGLTAREVFRTANLVEPSLIRVEADEATYNLHIMVRFELELALLRGDLQAPEIPGVWDEKYREYLGIEVPDDARGCLQDIHWSFGLFGYFPTYTLGNLYAAQIFSRAVEELGDPGFEKGDFTPLREWLNRRIHAQGQRFLAPDLVREVTGKAPDSEALLSHLEGRLRPVYGLA